MDQAMPDVKAARRARLRTIVKAILLGSSAVVLLAVLAAVIWVATPYRPDDTALTALTGSDSVEIVDTGGAITFRPSSPDPAGLILYPGGRVAVEAYAPLARRIADRGFLVTVIRMPLGLAVLDSDAAARIIAAEPAIERWVVGGHSLGGAMAARFAGRYPSDVAGLVLLAAYPPESSDLSSADLAVLSMRGTQDGLVSATDIESSRGLLPATTRFVLVPGGNHAGFGSYGPQRGDGIAALPAEAQQAAASLEIARVLDPQNP